MGKWCLQTSSFIFYRILVKLARNQDRDKISVRILAGSDQSLRSYVRIKFSIDVLWNLQFQLAVQTLEIFITLFSGTVRPRRLKLGTHMGRGQMYHVYLSQAAASYSSLYFIIFLSLQFSTLKFFVTLFSRTLRPRRLSLGTQVDRCIMYTGIRLLLLIHPFISSFFFLYNFQH